MGTQTPHAAPCDLPEQYHEIDPEATIQHTHPRSSPRSFSILTSVGTIVAQWFPYVGRAALHSAELKEVAVAIRVDVTGPELTTLK